MQMIDVRQWIEFAHKKLDNIFPESFHDRGYRHAMYDADRWMAEHFIEAEPVVRCKDCEAWQTATAMSFLRNGIHVRCCTCGVYGRLMYDDDFCSRGKRRAENA